MFRFTIRDVLWLTVVLAMAAAVLYTRSARVNDLQVATRRASEQETEAVKARYKAAKGEFEWHYARWHTGGSGVWLVTQACDAMERLAHAVEEMPDREVRVKELASALDLAQHLVSRTADKHEQGVEPAFKLYRAQYTSADMEARLRRAEQELAAARGNK